MNSDIFWVVVYPKENDKLKDLYFTTTISEISFWSKNNEEFIENIVGIFRDEKVAETVAKTILESVAE